MKVIKHGTTITKTKTVNKVVTCGVCGCEFEYSSNEVKRGGNGLGVEYVLCPECEAYCLDKDSKEVKEEEEEFSLSDLPHFPEDFYDFCGGVPQSDQDINDWIREAIDYFLAYPDEQIKLIACGDSILFALNMDDGVYFYVAKGHYEAYIE